MMVDAQPQPFEFMTLASVVLPSPPQATATTVGGAAPLPVRGSGLPLTPPLTLVSPPPLSPSPPTPPPPSPLREQSLPPPPEELAPPAARSLQTQTTGSVVVAAATADLYDSDADVVSSPPPDQSDAEWLAGWQAIEEFYSNCGEQESGEMGSVKEAAEGPKSGAAPVLAEGKTETVAAREEVVEMAGRKQKKGWKGKTNRSVKESSGQVRQNRDAERTQSEDREADTAATEVIMTDAAVAASMTTDDDGEASQIEEISIAASQTQPVVSREDEDVTMQDVASHTEIGEAVQDRGTKSDIEETAQNTKASGPPTSVVSSMSEVAIATPVRPGQGEEMEPYLGILSNPPKRFRRLAPEPDSSQYVPNQNRQEQDDGCQSRYHDSSEETDKVSKKTSCENRDETQLCHSSTPPTSVHSTPQIDATDMELLLMGTPGVDLDVNPLTWEERLAVIQNPLASDEAIASVRSDADNSASEEGLQHDTLLRSPYFNLSSLPPPTPPSRSLSEEAAMFDSSSLPSTSPKEVAPFLVVPATVTISVPRLMYYAARASSPQVIITTPRRTDPTPQPSGNEPNKAPPASDTKNEEKPLAEMEDSPESPKKSSKRGRKRRSSPSAASSQRAPKGRRTKATGPAAGSSRGGARVSKAIQQRRTPRVASEEPHNVDPVTAEAAAAVSPDATATGSMFEEEIVPTVESASATAATPQAESEDTSEETPIAQLRELLRRDTPPGGVSSTIVEPHTSIQAQPSSLPATDLQIPSSPPLPQPVPRQQPSPIWREFILRKSTSPIAASTPRHDPASKSVRFTTEDDIAPTEPAVAGPSILGSSTADPSLASPSIAGPSLVEPSSSSPRKPNSKGKQRKARPVAQGLNRHRTRSAVAQELANAKELVGLIKTPSPAVTDAELAKRKAGKRKWDGTLGDLLKDPSPAIPDFHERKDGKRVWSRLSANPSSVSVTDADNDADNDNEDESEGKQQWNKLHVDRGSLSVTNADESNDEAEGHAEHPPTSTKLAGVEIRKDKSNTTITGTSSLSFTAVASGSGTGGERGRRGRGGRRGRAKRQSTSRSTGGKTRASRAREEAQSADAEVEVEGEKTEAAETAAVATTCTICTTRTICTTCKKAETAAITPPPPPPQPAKRRSARLRGSDAAGEGAP